MLQAIHPDVSEVKWKYNRWHHEVNYKKFKENKAIFADGYAPWSNIAETSSFEMERTRVK